MLVALSVVSGCTTEQAPTLQATGVVIAADGASAAQVGTFSLRQNDGTTLAFKIMRLDLTNGGLPSAHLREHMSSGEPIAVYFHVENGVNIADRYTDAAQASPSGPSTDAIRPGPSPTTVASHTQTPPPSPTAAPSDGLPYDLALEPFAQGFLQLTFLANAGDGTGTLYAVEQRGVVWRIAADGTADHSLPFMSINSSVSCCNERGLLGLAFHPDFANNGRLFVDYTNTAGNTVVSEFHVGDDGTVDATSERILLGISQPFANHNGGMLAFGADGYLYIGTGDGGSGGDPMDNGQNWMTLLGKILRIDVDKGDPFAIPEGNPFPEFNHGGASSEIWDWGLRNPWRFSFDRATGTLWIGDVGQGQAEEVDAEAAGDGGHNYGWKTMEASHCYAVADCDQTGLTLPVAEYSHDAGCAIIGGYVYRGTAYPVLQGQYVFTDNCSGNLWAIDAAKAIADGMSDPILRGSAPIRPTGFGEDESGELYVVNGGGQIFRLIVN
ncbi:MAG: PQQ-dependent sugar dehydrogenase [Chloroflexota bacterium]